MVRSTEPIRKRGRREIEREGGREEKERAMEIGRNERRREEEERAMGNGGRRKG